MNKDEIRNENQKVLKINKLLAILCLLFMGGTIYFFGVAYDIFEKPDEVKSEEQKEIEAEIDYLPDNYYKDTYEKVEIVKNFIKNNYYKDTSDIDFEEAMIRGLFKSLDDPYSVYFNEEEYKAFNEESDGAYGGLGISIYPSETGYITVISAFKDTPAEKAGIKKDDKIIKVEGVEYSAEKMDIAISKMKGEPGTDVTITILRGEEEIEMTITRALIVLESAESEMLDEEAGIGYLKINGFDNKVYKEFLLNYEALEKEGLKALVLDLRSNPGGSLRECIEIADFILGEQTIVSTKDKEGNSTPYTSDARKINIPFVVLANGGSASASEILIGAIRDGDAAEIIGTKTFGKGIVQTIWPFSGNTGLKLTTSEYFTPSGENIHGKGIEPDIELELSEDYDPTDKTTDNQLQKAIELLRKKL